MSALSSNASTPTIATAVDDEGSELSLPEVSERKKRIESIAQLQTLLAPKAPIVSIFLRVMSLAELFEQDID